MRLGCKQSAYFVRRLGKHLEHSKLLVGGVAASPSAKNDRDVYIYIYRAKEIL